MHGVTTAIVGFIFVCLVFPSLVKNRPQFYGALSAVLLIILLDGIGYMINAVTHPVVIYGLISLLQIAAILLLILSVGGLTVRQLAGDVARAYEVIRRGEEEKEVVIPLSGQVPAPRDPEPPATVHRIDDPAPGGSTPPPPSTGSIPLT